MVFVDTGAWFTWFVPSDPDHALVKAWFDSNREPLLTTDYCVDETLTLLVARRRLPRALEAGRAFFEEPLAHVQFLMPEQIRRAWKFFQQRAAAGWSFTDCTSWVLINDLSIHKAVALDVHFKQFGNVTIVP